MCRGYTLGICSFTCLTSISHLYPSCSHSYSKCLSRVALPFSLQDRACDPGPANRSFLSFWSRELTQFGNVHTTQAGLTRLNSGTFGLQLGKGVCLLFGLGIAPLRLIQFCSFQGNNVTREKDREEMSRPKASGHVDVNVQTQQIYI